jgi:hypothetical protein
MMTRMLKALVSKAKPKIETARPLVFVSPGQNAYSPVDLERLHDR